MRIFLSVLLLFAFLPSYSGEERLTLWPSHFGIEATPVDLDWRDPSRKQLGQLTYLGGVQLTSAVYGFGGFSAMTVDGDRFTLLGDGGNFVRFRMGADWRVSDMVSGALVDGPGPGWRKLERDSESLTRDPATGTLWVGFERANQIWRYDPDLRHGRGVAPRAMAKWSLNGGAESLVRLRDGSFIAISEHKVAGAKGTREAIWFAGDPLRVPDRGFRFAYRPPARFQPTDAAELPDGRIAILNRRASLQAGFTASLTLIDRAAIRPGAIVTGQEVARFAAPVLHDNFEALAVSREGRDTILWIASDDNALWFQRSLLLKFRLDAPP
ncbi:esterase-like activity of phytase family protein [Sphingomonas turrisvirgatae]|uniref:Phytase-like domain-containing protein n=1 Tax=Sphingomonas turrisvirgatae TaxID=1888892 RepID=A0A1E3LY73_9SPHN|nr:esterase-like activity of phytase family protein [Sphingomonas turrisvirgatae]ODP38688.1 hypothetical protein BFL28_01255 [Sphingomonas turrisvirgatae]